MYNSSLPFVGDELFYDWTNNKELKIALPMNGCRIEVKSPVKV